MFYESLAKEAHAVSTPLSNYFRFLLIRKKSFQEKGNLKIPIFCPFCGHLYDPQRDKFRLKKWPLKRKRHCQQNAHGKTEPGKYLTINCSQCSKVLRKRWENSNKKRRKAPLKNGKDNSKTNLTEDKGSPRKKRKKKSDKLCGLSVLDAKFENRLATPMLSKDSEKMKKTSLTKGSNDYKAWSSSKAPLASDIQRGHQKARRKNKHEQLSKMLANDNLKKSSGSLLDFLSSVQ